MKKSMKKTMVLAMAGFMAAASLTAFGQTGSAADKKTLRVAMECGYAPYNWTQPDDANGAVPIADSSDYAYGYDVMMAKLIAEKLDYELEIYKLDWDALVPAVQSGVVDCVIAGQSITSERAEMVDFTEPYYYASIITLVKAEGSYANAASVAELSGATCTSQQNTVWYNVCLPQIPNANILPAQKSAPAMLVALEAGKCDLVVTDMPTGLAATSVYPNFKLLDFSGTDGTFTISEEEVNIGISLKKGNSGLKTAIDGVLSELTADDFNSMMDEAISVQPLSEFMPADFIGRIGYIIQQYAGSFIRGAGVTMVIAVVGTLIGCVIGFVAGLVQTIPIEKNYNIIKILFLRGIKLILNIYVEVFRGTPMMAQAAFIFYGSAAVFQINMSMWFAAFFIVSINTGAYMAETVRGGILSIDSGQTEGAKAIGMTHYQTMSNVILPQAIRNIMPQIGNNLIINIKDTCVLSIIGTVELFYTTSSVTGALYTFFEAYTIAMVIYFVLTFTCSRILRVWEKKMDGPDSYDLATTDTLAHTSGLIRYPDKKEVK